MNLKERLSSTENLLRSIRSGGGLSSQPQGQAQQADAPKQGSIWTRRISLGDVFSGLGRRSKTAETATEPPPPAAPLAQGPNPPPSPSPNPAAAPAAPASKPSEPKARASRPFWSRQISFGRKGKALCIGISTSGPCLCLAVVRGASGTLVAARRFPMAPDQAPGEKGFQALLSASLQSLGYAGANCEMWAVLRSPDLDLNVLSVPKLTGAKLDAAIYWTLQKEKKFAEAEYILDYRVLGPTAESSTPKIDVLTCLARRADVERLREVFRAAGYPLTGITAIPNSFLNLYLQPNAPKGYALAANIHVEPDFSAIGLYTQNRLVFSRFIRSGAGSMAETLVEHFQDLAKPKPLPAEDLELPLPGAARPTPEANATVLQPLDSDQAHALLRHVLLSGPKPSFAMPAHLLKPEQMVEILTPAIVRLGKQVERTLDYYASTQQARCDALHLSGDIFSSPPIMQALGAQLGFSPMAFDATAILGSGGALVPGEDRMSLAPALAAALSPPGRGINLLTNYKVRTATEAKATITRSIVLGLAGLLTLIAGAGVMLERANVEKQGELRSLKAQQSRLGPKVDEGSLMGLIAQFRARQDALREVSLRLLVPAALTEISRRAPENVKILSITSDSPPPESAKPAAPAAPQQDKQAKPQSEGFLVIEGVVTGNKAAFDATLSRFILQMQASPMFAMPVVNETGLKELGSSGQVLYFVMHVGVK